MVVPGNFHHDFSEKLLGLVMGDPRTWSLQQMSSGILWFWVIALHK